MNARLRKQRARLGGLTKSARHNGREGTAKARATFLQRFEDAVRAEFPDLPEAEVQRRAEAARKAHFTRLAFASARARRDR